MPGIIKIYFNEILKNKHIEIIDDKFFTIFKVENFFDIGIYEELKKNYPVIIPKKNFNKIDPFAGTLKHIACLRLNWDDGAPARIRTADLLITNQLLYQLSYKGLSVNY